MNSLLPDRGTTRKYIGWRCPGQPHLRGPKFSGECFVLSARLPAAVAKALSLAGRNDPASGGDPGVSDVTDHIPTVWKRSRSSSGILMPNVSSAATTALPQGNSECQTADTAADNGDPQPLRVEEVFQSGPPSGVLAHPSVGQLVSVRSCVSFWRSTGGLAYCVDCQSRV
jgi:hypothetical protein